MPKKKRKKVRTWEDQLKSQLNKRPPRPNPLQKLPEMTKEHLLKSHTKLLEQARKDLETLANRKFWDDPSKKKFIIIDQQHDFVTEASNDLYLSNAYAAMDRIPQHILALSEPIRPVDDIYFTTQFPAGIPPGSILVVDRDIPLVDFGERREMSPEVVDSIIDSYQGVNPSEDPDWEAKVAFMRADLACGMGYTHIIETVRRRMKEDGKDFDTEFKKWKEKRNAPIKSARILLDSHPFLV